MSVRIIVGDALAELRKLPDESVQMCCTSPPYWGLRDYGVAGQLGLEVDFRDYISAMLRVFGEVRRVLRQDGTVWLNLGDSYTSGNRATWRSGASENKGQNVLNDMPRPVQPEWLKPKDLIGIPWRVAFSLQEDGWWLRSDIIWSKPNPMPESVTDRPTKAHEYLFLLTKADRYYYDADAIKEVSVTDDPRRPYTSEGAWQLDGRPAEQRHGGEVRNAYRQPNSPQSIKSPHGQGFTRRAGHGQSEEDYARLNGRQDALHNRSGRALGDKGEQTPAEVRSSAGARMGRGAGWRDDPSTTPFTRNKRSVWTVATAPYSEAHFATFPPALIEPCILAGCPEGGTVLDPFGGAGTTGLVADRLGRNAILIELNESYAAMAKQRIEGDAGLFAAVELATAPPSGIPEPPLNTDRSKES